MKKIICALSLISLTFLSSCDDGDVVYKDIDFSKNTTVSKCTNIGAEKIYYKIQETEALIMILDTNTIMSDPGQRLVDVNIDGTSTSLEYRKYSAKLDQSNICNIPAPAFPNVTQSIPTSPGGTVRIERMIHVKNNESSTSNTTTLTYQYSFTLLNINFVDANTNIKYDKMYFGTNTYENRTLSFNFNNSDNSLKNINTCNDQYIGLSDREAIILDLKPEDFPTDETVKTIDLNENRKVSFKHYKRAGINIDQVCKYKGDIPGSSEANTNTLLELWVARNGKIQIESRWTNPVEGERKLVHKVSVVDILLQKDQYEDIQVMKSFDVGQVEEQ
ncbi:MULTISPECIES: hypothetical protein [Myroides]|uniref:Lipoprotein n=1 Tax=Myroides albus TaxID=2562892 RepID=A0A6I3LPE5_9FLAO|nr:MULTISPECIES: hypothetical protein [Myroides]MTG97845.1 hypothetical protein [Myroides albus]MVX35967.1 hypothetical protein [Myroides sp. LoEW2-1]UVD79802.1 hypothetical protein NWE55_00470 [Myroides albus]